MSEDDSTNRRELPALETGCEAFQEVPGVVVRVLGRWLGPREEGVL